MKLKYFFVVLALFPGVSSAVVREGSVVRVGVGRTSNASARMPTMATAAPAVTSINVSDTGASQNDVVEPGAEPVEPLPLPVSQENPNCREEYRACMDEFCLLNESEGARCACSSNIHKSKELIQEIQQIQEEADKLYTEGVEREQLGAKVSLVFGESEQAKKASKASGISFLDWINGTNVDAEELGTDNDIGDGLYSMAADFCRVYLDSCESRADMEEMLYSRQIGADCKAFDAYLKDQKINATANKRTAEAAVRKARLEMLGTTNKYNRGECLLAYRSCIADKGGCGVNFENCLDADLLERRANACNNVLDQCMAVKNYVLEDWESESESILAEATKYADIYARQTCNARVQNCLEESCSPDTNPMCLTNVNVAASLCPVIDECDALAPGFKDGINQDLGFLRTKFCQNDIDKCLRDRCGENFTAPECVGKSSYEIAALCPQDMYPSCKNEKQFNIIVQAILLQMDYKIMQGCINHFAEQLGNVCGTDMACLPMDAKVASLVTVPTSEEAINELRELVRKNTKTSVDEFFEQFEQDVTVAACLDSKKPKGRSSLGGSVFNSAKMIAETSAENRALRELESKIAELSREQGLKEAENTCYTLYKVETPDLSKKGSFTYIRSVSFEPALRNCHVCRIQRVCESGGESKGAAALKGAAGGLSVGASTGTMVSPGWGTAIGAVVGAVGGGFGAGLLSDGIQEFCQDIESCKDINL